MRALEGTFWLLNLCGDLLIALVVILLVEQARQVDRRRPLPGSTNLTAVEQEKPEIHPALAMYLDRDTRVDMDKKIKKKLEVLHQRLQKLRQQLAGAKKQMDEPEEVRRLEAEIQQAEADVVKLKES